MKNFKQTFRVILATALAAITLCGCSPKAEPLVLTDSTIGERDGYGYELWKDYGDTTMTITDNGKFSCEWSNINNALFRIGRKFDCTQTYRDMENIKIDYSADYQPDGNSYFCVYGWTREPLVEYYVVESWGNWRPPGGNSLATITVDGAKYDIYKTVRVNQPSIDGNTTFVQYWSVRQEPSTSGTVNLSTHFAAWEKLGLPVGKLYEAALTVEGYQSQGKANITKNVLTISGEIKEPNESEFPEPIKADENGNYTFTDFESSKNGWGERGSSKVAITNDVSYDGEKSLSVTNRADSWNGVQYNLSTADYHPGTAYSFSVYAMQNSSDTTDFKLTLQYVDASGQTKYDCIAEISGANGEWVELGNPSYVLPDGAWDLLLYVETAGGTNDFFIDNAAIGVAK